MLSPARPRRRSSGSCNPGEPDENLMPAPSGMNSADAHLLVRGTVLRLAAAASTPGGFRYGLTAARGLGRFQTAAEAIHPGEDADLPVAGGIAVHPDRG